MVKADILLFFVVWSGLVLRDDGDSMLNGEWIDLVVKPLW